MKNGMSGDKQRRQIFPVHSSMLLLSLRDSKHSCCSSCHLHRHSFSWCNSPTSQYILGNGQPGRKVLSLSKRRALVPPPRVPWDTFRVDNQVCHSTMSGCNPAPQLSSTSRLSLGLNDELHKSCRMVELFPNSPNKAARFTTISTTNSATWKMLGSPCKTIVAVR